MMEVCTKGIGNETWLMDKVELYMLMEISMMVNGRMIRHMDMESIRNQMGLSMMENGSMGNNME